MTTPLTVPVPAAWLERLIEIAEQVHGKVNSADPYLAHLFGYIESAQSMLPATPEPNPTYHKPWNPYVPGV